MTSPVVRAVISKLDPEFDFSALDGLKLAERPDSVRENQVCGLFFSQISTEFEELGNEIVQ